MFSKETYMSRRARLKESVKSGIILLMGNNDAPVNYSGNTYYPFRQDSTFLYYFGQHRSGLVGVIDVDNDCEMLIGDDIDIEDIVWFGAVESVRALGEQVGVGVTAPMKHLEELCTVAKARGRRIHFLPPYRHDTMIQLMDLTGIHPLRQRTEASLELIMAVVNMRAVKEQQEIEAIERACDVGYEMHTLAMRMIRQGVNERYIAGQVSGLANSLANQVSFATIFSQHGEIMHGVPRNELLQEGRLVLCDAGCELDDYCSDHTRTTPVSGKFSKQQADIYNIVAECHDYALKVARPGVKWLDVHMDVCRLMTDRLKELGLMKGDTEEAVRAGAHAMFLPHGLGHMMGMDVHDMEGLGQQYVGFDDEVRPSTQFGTNCLRCGRRLQEGWVMTDEPGIYFIPDLIDDWRSRGHNAEFINFGEVEKYRGFGGVRIEDDILITADGCRFLGSKRIPYKAADVEEYMARNNECVKEIIDRINK